MSLGALDLVSLFLVPVLLGAGLLTVLGIRFRDDRLAFLGWAYVLGALGTGAVLYVFAWVHGPFRAPVIAGILGGVSALLLFLGRGMARGASRPAAPRELRTWPLAERLAFAAVVVLLVSVLVARSASAAALPVIVGDEANLWAFKAKLLFHSGGFGQAFADQKLLTGARHHLDYPPLNPLLQVWAFAHAGTLLLVENRFPIQAFGIALVLVLGASLRRLVRPGLAAALLLLVIGSAPVWNLQVRANADTMVLLGLLLAGDAWLRWRDSGEWRWLALCSAGLALCVGSKHEGALHAVLFGALALAVGGLLARDGRRDVRTGSGYAAPGRRALLLFALPALALAGTWSVNLSHGFGNDLLSSTLSGREPEYRNCTLAEERAPTRDLPERFAFVSARFSRWLGGAPTENNLLLLVAVLLAVAFPRRALAGDLRFLTLFCCAIHAASLLVYLRTPHELEWHWETSALRFLGQPLGVVALWIALWFRRCVPWASGDRTSSPRVAPR